MAKTLADQGLQDQIVWCDFWPAIANFKRVPLDAVLAAPTATVKRVLLLETKGLQAEEAPPPLAPIIPPAVQNELQAQLDKLQNLNPRG
jgi:hypothetical protein